MTRRINEEDHPEIFWQLRLYAWLFELAVGLPPLRLEVFNGVGNVVPIEKAPSNDIIARLAQIIRGTDAPFEPVGWTRCNGCAYSDLCWTEAKTRRDVAL